MQLSHQLRVLPIVGGYNFRDLGGIKTNDGKEVIQNLLIRTDELSNLENQDLDYLAEINVKSIVDFRTKQEREISVDKVPTTCENEFHLDIMAGNMNDFFLKIKQGNSDYKNILSHFYSDLVTSPNAIESYQHFFEILQNKENCSVVYHCTAGKDRTGIATALILECLNVDRNVIEEDYLLSNHFLQKKYEGYISLKPELEDLFLVKSEYINYAYDMIINKYYSVIDYLTDVLKVDIDVMKKNYTH